MSLPLIRKPFIQDFAITVATFMMNNAYVSGQEQIQHFRARATALVYLHNKQNKWNKTWNLLLMVFIR